MAVAAMSEAPGWLVSVVAEGLQRLTLLRLDGCPPADAIEGVAMAWVDALMLQPIAWDEALDRERVRMAFRRAAAHARRWPVPVELMELMPPRPERAKLAPPPPDERQRAQALRMIEELRRKFGSR